MKKTKKIIHKQTDGEDHLCYTQPKPNWKKITDFLYSCCSLLWKDVSCKDCLKLKKSK